MAEEEKKKKRKLEKRYIIIGVIVTIAIIGLILLLSSPVLLWKNKAENDLKVFVIDKSVPNELYREHAALFWVLNHNKTSPINYERPWTLNRDYLGYYPKPTPLPNAPPSPTPSPYGEKLKAEHLKGSDMLFVADSYGVYTLDLEEAEKKEERKVLGLDLSTLKAEEATDYSAKIYGGFDGGEVGVIENYYKQGHHLIGEFNTFASPTEGGNRTRLENLFGVKWSGWAGRFFEDLSNRNEVPGWAFRNWKKHYGTDWKFEGPGFLLTHEDSRITVLEEKHDVEIWGLRILDVKEKHPLMKDAYNDVPFYFWFDIVEPKEGSEVLATYKFKLMPSGKAKFKKLGIPEQFPSVIVSAMKPLKVYMAGDFSDNKVDRGPYYVAGLPEFNAFGRMPEKRKNQEAFFWEFYNPLVRNIIEIASKK